MSVLHLQAFPKTSVVPETVDSVSLVSKTDLAMVRAHAVPAQEAVPA